MSVILDFIEMLRYFGLPISPSETITAQQAYEIFGVTDYKTLQYGLKAAILKRHEDNGIFNTCFNQFFVKGSNNYVEEMELPHERTQYLQRLNRSSYEIDAEIGQLLIENQIEEAVQTTLAMMQSAGDVGSGSSFNQQFDEEIEPIEIGTYGPYSPSELLFNIDSDAYQSELQNYDSNQT